MKRHQEVRLSSSRLSARQILEAAVRFAQESGGWERHPNGVREAGMGIGEHCVIVSLRPPAAGIALVAEDGNPKAVHVTNIVPRDTDELTFAECNSIARLFHEALRSYCRERKLALKVTITPEDRGLEVAISGAKCRRYFEDYLHGFPQTHHPSDVARLDAFICAVHRYGSRCDPDGVAQYLREALKLLSVGPSPMFPITACNIYSKGLTPMPPRDMGVPRTGRNVLEDPVDHSERKAHRVWRS